MGVTGMSVERVIHERATFVRACPVLSSVAVTVIGVPRDARWPRAGRAKVRFILDATANQRMQRVKCECVLSNSRVAGFSTILAHWSLLVFKQDAVATNGESWHF